MQFLDQPLNHIGSQRTSRSSADMANPFRSFEAPRRRLPLFIYAVVTVAACAAIGVMLAWRG